MMASTPVTQPLRQLPKGTYLPINRCNLPATILGGLTFQQQPVPLQIDGVAHLHADLFRRLDELDSADARVRQFEDYLDVHFRLDDPSAAGFKPGGRGRPKATWRRTLRGWFFDTDSREAAVLKSWVESRFGLLPRFHQAPIRDFSGEAYLAYLEARARGLYNTNSLEAQLDLVYSFCQYQLSQQQQSHLLLYRGVNRPEQLEQLPGCSPAGDALPALLLNNLNSFSCSVERASEFGDRVLAIRVPCEKVFCYDALFPGQLNGEGEYVVIGGLYQPECWVY
ncbi:NAD(+)--dinitrogen-reductase ADP-D-ribosyltransferase [Motiliproteus sediminis]|uniref:NAD(+)--dinitrogen-reductase ADP-D-ribosyltransferase n=1 Tax=Motiliproteus sediminis TaxID=1468178 RepID=UPI001AEF50E4|nr:NAD(+)--dinitrogen-reductase ADP-D-ribosyltransferase [Motiliproteus sediminis]